MPACTAGLESSLLELFAQEVIMGLRRETGEAVIVHSRCLERLARVECSIVSAAVSVGLPGVLAGEAVWS